MDLKNGQVMTNDLGTFSVVNSKLAPNAINHAKVADFNLTNQDVGVLFAEVTSVATLASSSGGTVTVTRVGEPSAGRYEVDFGRNIASCAAVATIGYHSTAVSSPGETPRRRPHRQRRGGARGHPLERGCAGTEAVPPRGGLLGRDGRTRGADRNRTGVNGFAGRCVTTPPRRRGGV